MLASREAAKKVSLGRQPWVCNGLDASPKGRQNIPLPPLRGLTFHRYLVHGLRPGLMSTAASRLGYCSHRDRAGFRQILDAPAKVHELPLAVWSEDTVGESLEFVLQNIIGHRVVEAADGMLDNFFKAAAIFGCEDNPN